MDPESEINQQNLVLGEKLFLEGQSVTVLAIANSGVYLGPLDSGLVVRDRIWPVFRYWNTISITKRIEHHEQRN